MTIGSKNRRVEFWAPTGEVDAANQPLPDAWALHKLRWAEVKGETGMGAIRGADRAGIKTPLDRYSYRINYDPSITVKMQLRLANGVRLDIIAVRHDEAQRKWTDVIVNRGGSDGG